MTIMEKVYNFIKNIKKEEVIKIIHSSSNFNFLYTDLNLQSDESKLISNILYNYENKDEKSIKEFKEEFNKLKNIDRFTVFLIKKSLLDLNFYDFILDLNIDKLNNILLNEIIWFFKSGIHFDLENEIMNLIFYDEIMSNKIHNELLKIEPDEKIKITYDKIMFKIKLENKLEQKEKVKRVKI